MVRLGVKLLRGPGRVEIEPWHWVPREIRYRSPTLWVLISVEIARAVMGKILRSIASQAGVSLALRITKRCRVRLGHGWLRKVAEAECGRVKEHLGRDLAFAVHLVVPLAVGRFHADDNRREDAGN